MTITFREEPEFLANWTKPEAGDAHAFRHALIPWSNVVSIQAKHAT